MLTAILPVISLTVSLVRPIAGAGDEMVATPRAAQVRLAEVLAEADAIHGVARSGIRAKRGQHVISFAIDRGDIALRIDATTRAGGEVISLTVVPAGPALGDLGSLSWLSPELAQTTAITKLTVDEDGAITITTNDDRAYMAIPGRGSGGSNTATSARWAAAWNDDDAS